MNTYKYIIIAIGLASAGAASGQETENNALKTIAPDLIMGVSPEGEVQFYKYVEPLTIPHEPTTEYPQASIHLANDPGLPDDSIYFAAQSPIGNSQSYQAQGGYRTAPGTQGSFVPITDAEEEDLIDALARKATEQAHEAAKSLCGMGAVRPESVSFTVGVPPLAATVGWSVDSACEASQEGE